MKNLSLIASALAMLGLTACEKGLDEGVADVAPAGQVTNSVLKGSPSEGGREAESKQSFVSKRFSHKSEFYHGLHFLRHKASKTPL